jgi:prepilin-type N-terminal cleavage/methylation domain-containing protein
MSPTTTDEGFSVLEVLVGLAIVGLLTAVAAATITPAAPARGVERDVRRFVADARADAILRGTSGLLVAGDAALTYRQRRLPLEARGSARLLIYPDGTMGGDRTEFSRVVGTPIAGVFR